MDSNGPAQDDFKPAFLAELVRTCQQNPLPTLIGGDFNITRTFGAMRALLFEQSNPAI